MEQNWGLWKGEAIASYSCHTWCRGSWGHNIPASPVGFHTVILPYQPAQHLFEMAWEGYLGFLAEVSLLSIFLLGLMNHRAHAHSSARTKQITPSSMPLFLLTWTPSSPTCLCAWRTLALGQKAANPRQTKAKQRWCLYKARAAWQRICHYCAVILDEQSFRQGV